MKPYYEDNYITLYLGDSREIIPQLEMKFSAVITDPVWQETPKGMFPYVDNPFELFKDVAQYFPAIASRVVIQIGVLSDPRFLSAIPAEMPFLRVCWLEMKLPSFKGRCMVGSDVAYVYGNTPKDKGCIPGRYMDRRNEFKKEILNYHPCSRKMGHMQWLVKYFAESGPIIDPFAGSCTTGIAAKMAGIPSVMIEIKEEFCEKAVKKISKYNGFDFNDILK